MAHQESQVFEDEPALILCLPKLNELRMAGELTDLAIELQDHVTLHVHSVVLVCRVPSLHDIVCGMPRKRLPFSLQWPTVSSKAAKPLLDYVYTGKLEVNGANAEGLMMLSKQLVLPQVQQWVQSFMAARLNSENLADTWNFARLVDGDQLTDACLQYIKTNFEPTIVSDFFTQLPVDTVLTLLRADDLRVEREENVFEAIKLWVSPGGEVDDVRVVHAAELMREVRWNRVNPEFRYDLLEKKGFWSTNVECLQLLGCISGWFECPSARVDRRCPYTETYRDPLENICVVGTSATNNQSVLIRYEVETSTSEQLEVLGNRNCAPFVAIKDCIFAIGTLAQNGSYSKVEKFDTKELQWSERAPLSMGRQYHAAVGVPVRREGVVCVFGGYAANCGLLSSCELYSPQENKWYALPQLKQSRQYATAVSLPDGRVFVIGGVDSSHYPLSSVEACIIREPGDWQGMQNTSGDFWRTVAPMTSPRSGHTAIAFKSSIFVAGGTTTYSQIANTVEVFIPPHNQQPMGQWTKLTNATLDGPTVKLVVWQDRLFAFCSKNNTPNSILEFVSPPSPCSPSYGKFDLWTWTDRGTVGVLKTINHAFILR